MRLRCCYQVDTSPLTALLAPKTPAPKAGERRNYASRTNLIFLFRIMSLGNILLVILVLMVLGALPTWPHSRNWGYAPSGGLGLILAILLVLFLLGRI